MSGDNANTLSDASKLHGGREHRINDEEELSSTPSSSSSSTTTANSTSAQKEEEEATEYSNNDTIDMDLNVRNITDSRGIFSNVVNSIKRGQLLLPIHYSHPVTYCRVIRLFQLYSSVFSLEREFPIRKFFHFFPIFDTVNKLKVSKF